MSTPSTESDQRPGKEFPYERLLAFYREELPDDQASEVQHLVETDPLWKAHFESMRHLDLERDAARHDGALLRVFDVNAATRYCQAVAQTDGEVFRLLTEGAAAARGWSRERWAKHAEGCVFCRRHRRVMHARVQSEKGPLRGEPAMRDWLLGWHYLGPLQEVASKLCQRYHLERVAALPPAVVPGQLSAEDTVNREGETLPADIPEEVIARALDEMVPSHMRLVILLCAKLGVNTAKELIEELQTLDAEAEDLTSLRRQPVEAVQQLLEEGRDLLRKAAQEMVMKQERAQPSVGSPEKADAAGRTA